MKLCKSGELTPVTIINSATDKSALFKHIRLDLLEQRPQLSTAEKDSIGTFCLDMEQWASVFFFLVFTGSKVNKFLFEICSSIVKYFFMSSLNLHCFCLKSFPLVLSQQTLLKSALYLVAPSPFRYWKAAIRYPQSLLYSGLSIPSCLSLSLWGSPRGTWASGWRWLAWQIEQWFAAWGICRWLDCWPVELTLCKSSYLLQLY